VNIQVILLNNPSDDMNGNGRRITWSVIKSSSLDDDCDRFVFLLMSRCVFSGVE